MGVSMGFSSGCEKESPNPNPLNFEIITIEEVSGHTIVLALYADCINYGGKKLLIFKNINKNRILSLKSMNPHFLQERGIFPFARFEPTEAGARAAIKLASIL